MLFPDPLLVLTGVPQQFQRDPPEPGVALQLVFLAVVEEPAGHPGASGPGQFPALAR